MVMTVNKSDEFFISIAKQGVHSFIFVGVKSKGEHHILARVGKVMDADVSCSVLRAAFFSTKAFISYEEFSKQPGRKIPIGYAAYDITYEQYLGFIALLEELQARDNIAYPCFKPAEENGNEVNLQWTAQRTEVTHKIPLKPEAENIIKESHSLNLSSTCRHGALSLLDYVRGHEQTIHNVSSKFFRDLPLHTNLVADDGEKFPVRDPVTKRIRQHCYLRPDSKMPFYILPSPPSAFKDLEPLKKRVLTELYMQMEDMLQVAPESAETEQKFNLLKELYIEKVGKNNETINDFIASLTSWREDHKKDINSLRKTYFFDYFITRHSATEKMFDRFDEYFTNPASVKA
ncbi:hypothetical protein [Legionella brunensis]|uniref:Uncharacterized protein n=1 Tax=Legionella brunensis TaxID=29422 RepID=A0A0W0S1D5_9GAMM|nr:hypothetical protein [Legionella brunensis]KTC77115.1 hypothetical protein Lbru_3222 [Legionella brunensis]